jgi:hypothetical protein
VTPPAQEAAAAAVDLGSLAAISDAVESGLGLPEVVRAAARAFDASLDAEKGKESGDIGYGRQEDRGGLRRILAESTEHERHERSRDAGHHHRDHHGTRDHRHEAHGSAPSPHREAGRQRDRHPVDQSHTGFFPDHTGPVTQADLAQDEPPHGDGEGLCSGVARLTGHDRQQDRERRDLRDDVLEQPDDGGGEKRGQEIDLQPGQSLANGEDRTR